MLRIFLTVASIVLVTQTLGTISVQATPISQQADQTGTPSWVNCADEGKHCYPDSDGVITMRYGEGDNYTYILTQGLNRISCNNFWGNPSDGKNKKCAYTTTNLLNVASENSYVDVANQGETFKLPYTGKMHWIRYGSGNRWMYTVMSGDGEQSVACTNDYFNYNPSDGTTKVCQYSQNAYYTLSENDTLTECATQGQSCAPQVGDVVLMRYGIDDKFDWRFVHAATNTYACNNETFGTNPIHKTKRCYWMAVAPSAISTFGQWSKVGSCNGKGCSISETIATGTTRTNTWSTTADWSTTVTESVEESFEVLGAGGKVSEQVSVSFALSENFQTALSRSVTETFTAICDPDKQASNRALFQFLTKTTESCLESLNCTGTTFTKDYTCVSNPPAGYGGPQCVPGYCREDDQLCLEPCAE